MNSATLNMEAQASLFEILISTVWVTGSYGSTSQMCPCFQTHQNIYIKILPCFLYQLYLNTRPGEHLYGTVQTQSISIAESSVEIVCV